MIVRKTVGTVGTLAQEAVTTAVSLAKHPISSTALAAGLVKGAAGAGIGLVRNTITGTSPTPDSETDPAEAAAERLSPEAEEPAPEPVQQPAESAEPAKPAKPAERDLPGPDLAHFEPPRPEDLPEPIVIVADDDPGESFHTEPKAANRDSARGGTPGDHEEIEGYVEEIPTDDIDIETPVGTTGADVGFNPDTAEADLQQPQTPPVLDPGTVAAIESESEILRRAAERNPS
jgi:hypothetical protein